MKARSEHSRAERWLGPGELARQANTSIKALRVYECAGLLEPERRKGGWRIYGPDHIARLHQILTLKALGLSLKQIRKALGSDGLAIGEILALQALHLEQDIRSARRRLRQVQNARQHIAQTGIVPADVLLGLAHDLTSDRPPELAELRALIETLAWQGGVVDEVRDALRTCSGGDGSTLEIQVGDLLDDAAILAVEAEPGSSRAAAMADRWLALAARLDLPTGDARGAAALRDLSAQLAADPCLADTFAFLREAIRLRTRIQKTKD